jgi:hypothetical protein
MTQPSERTAEDQAWADAYRVNFPGASNPVAVASALARNSAALLHEIGTDGIREHPALRAIAGHLAFLYGYSLGAEVYLLDETEINAVRLGIKHD